MAHEIAHWLVADEGRRRYVNYGWGHDYQFIGYIEPFQNLDEFDYLKALPWAADEDAPNDAEEISASLLGFAMLVRLNVPAPYEDYGFYEWTGGADGKRRIDPTTYRERRGLQPFVADFTTWLAGYRNLRRRA